MTTHVHAPGMRYVIDTDQGLDEIDAVEARALLLQGVQRDRSQHRPGDSSG